MDKEKAYLFIDKVSSYLEGTPVQYRNQKEVRYIVWKMCKYDFYHTEEEVKELADIVNDALDLPE